MRCYDALLYKGKPDLGIDRVHIVYHMHQHVVRNERGVADADLTPTAMIDAIINDGRGQLVCFDQESFGSALDPMYERKGYIKAGSHREATAWMIRFVQRVRERPGGSSLRLGYYGIGWWDHPHRAAGSDVADLASLKSSRDSLGQFKDTGIIDLIDVVMPSLYVRQADWRQHVARSRVRLEVFAEVFERPICPFVWGKFHDSLPEIGADDLPIEWARRFARMLRPLMDDWRVEAPILWGGHPTTEWDDPEWVRAFMEA